MKICGACNDDGTCNNDVIVKPSQHTPTPAVCIETDKRLDYVRRAVNRHKDNLHLMKAAVKDIENGSYENALSVLRFAIAKGRD